MTASATAIACFTGNGSELLAAVRLRTESTPASPALTTTMNRINSGSVSPDSARRSLGRLPDIAGHCLDIDRDGLIPRHGDGGRARGLAQGVERNRRRTAETHAARRVEHEIRSRAHVED